MFQAIDEILRSEGDHSPAAPRVPWRSLCVGLVLGCSMYGATMGLWSLNAEQIVYSATKVPVLLVFTSAVCLPNFYVLHSVLGLREDFGAALRGVIQAQATIALFLLGAAPIIGFVYASGISYPGATLANGAAFLCASLAAQWTLARHYRPLIRKEPRHRITLVIWLLLYQFVAIQLAWTLRPFIGSPQMYPQFLRSESMTNAFVEVTRLIRSVLGGLP